MADEYNDESVYKQDDEEIKFCIKMLMDTDAGTGFMHESFHKDDSKKFTRAWFAWQNTLFGELILKLVNDGRLIVVIAYIDFNTRLKFSFLYC